MNNSSSNMNRLQSEKSPYLLQHATNPVDWYPWGEAAFEKARREDKPIFLSIGYSTCHWCHVMAHESFENDEVAHFLNDIFVCIKVDREERPDIDHVYMTVCQMMTGSGGWPLSIIMTPDKRPFFAGTYIPKETVFGRMGMLDLIAKVHDIWKNHREEVLQAAEKITRTLEQSTQPYASESVNQNLIKNAFTKLKQNFDTVHGGFGDAPKFPAPHNLMFLLRFWEQSQNDAALQMVEKTLQAMRLGGIYDHIGFGFHRYSTDSYWLLPHFEKMLYDQALMALAYLETFQVTQNNFYAETAKEIFTYVLRDMTAPEGGFYSAEDADSEGQEGKFYVWSPEQIREALGKQDAEWVQDVYNIVEGGNFFDQATQKKTGESIPFLAKSTAEIAADLDLKKAEFGNQLEQIREKLFRTRNSRVHPHKDDKILTDWNGLMLAALSRGYQVLDDPAYLTAAEKSAEFLLTKLRNQEGRLLHRYRDGEAAIPANLDDYAFVIWGLIELYQANFQARFLKIAQELTNLMIAHFADETAGGFFFTPNDTPDLLVRQKIIYDGAIPSGNSVAMMNLLRLSRMTGNSKYEQLADKLSRAFAREIKSFPSAHCQFMSALNLAHGKGFEVVIVGEPNARETRQMLNTLHRHYLPNMVVLFRPTTPKDPEITRLATFTKNQQCIDGKTTAYVCQNFQCKTPTTNITEMLEFLGK